MSAALYKFEQRTVYFYDPQRLARGLDKLVTQRISSARHDDALLGKFFHNTRNQIYQPLHLNFIHSGLVDKKDIFFYDPAELAGEHDPFRNIEDEPWSDDSGDNIKLPQLEKVYLKPELLATWQQIKKRFADTLTDQLSAEPAKLTPFRLEVDTAMWEVRSNRRPCRPQTVENDEQIKSQVAKLVELGILQYTKDAAFYSHPHMVRKKSGDKKRFTVDFRFLNECCASLSWPIPNMELLLERIGRQSPKNKYFAVIDLTSGYHQLAIDKDSRKFTAFLTRFGLLEWARLPMGLKGAASWFQQQIATKVLAGLIEKICELYIDDIIVYAETQEELLERVSEVLSRLQQFNVKANPSKLVIGLENIEYVGRSLSHDGIELSAERKQQIFEIAEPTLQKGMKSFLGMTGYFRAHIPKYVDFERPLQTLITPYKKSVKIDWSPYSRTAFSNMKQAVLDCQKLWFINEHLANSEIVLQTDASDYGIGAFLLQRFPDEHGTLQERPIKILSRALRGSELNWSTVEKESFAIYFACDRWYHLLGGRKFTIETDHKNLTYISEATSQKVIKWKLAIAELNFQLRHIPGVTNVVADGTSRLCFLSSSVTSANFSAPYLKRLMPNIYGPPKIRWIKSYNTKHTLNASYDACISGKCAHKEQPIFDKELAEPLHAAAFLSRLALPSESDICSDRILRMSANNSTFDVLDSYLRTDLDPDESSIYFPSSIPPEWISNFHEEVIITDEVRAIFRKHHNAERGHTGLDKTFSRVLSDLQANSASEPHLLRAQLRKLISACPHCQKMTYIRTPIYTKNFTLSTSYPWQRIAVDTIGPFEKDDDDNQYIIIIIEEFTRFVQLYAAKDGKAIAAAKSLLHYFGTFPVPEQILSDNGSQYVNKVVKELVGMMGSEHITIHPGSHQENSIAERANKEVLRHLIGFTQDRMLRSSWSTVLPLVSRIINGEVHTSTGVAPNQLVFGLMAHKLSDVLLYPFTREELATHDNKLSLWSTKILSLQNKVLQAAIKLQEEKNKRHQLMNDSDAITEFDMNSYVLIHYGFDKMSRPKSKLHTPWTGPLQVVGVNSKKTVYTCRNLVTGLLEDHHIKLLKPFTVDEGVDPYRIALADTSFRHIEKILKHKGESKTQRKSSLEFLVKFADSSQPEWCAWKDICASAVLHTYLKEHKLDHLILERFKDNGLDSEGAPMNMSSI
jgi:hypothetical protein